MKTLEEVTYEAGRDALADQEALVAGIRQRTGTLLAAHALVASFLGATTIRAVGLEPLSWIALGTLVAGLVLAAVLLAPWEMKFAVDAPTLIASCTSRLPPRRRTARSAGSRPRGLDTRLYARRMLRACG